MIMKKKSTKEKKNKLHVFRAVLGMVKCCVHGEINLCILCLESQSSDCAITEKLLENPYQKKYGTKVKMHPDLFFFSFLLTFNIGIYFTVTSSD